MANGVITQREMAAIDEFYKILCEGQTPHVKCPNCGTEICHITEGSAEITKCQTENCLYDVLRGL